MDSKNWSVFAFYTVTAHFHLMISVQDQSQFFSVKDAGWLDSQLSSNHHLWQLWLIRCRWQDPNCFSWTHNLSKSITLFDLSLMLEVAFVLIGSLVMLVNSLLLRLNLKPVGNSRDLDWLWGVPVELWSSLIYKDIQKLPCKINSSRMFPMRKSTIYMANPGWKKIVKLDLLNGVSFFPGKCWPESPMISMGTFKFI